MNSEDFENFNDEEIEQLDDSIDTLDYDNHPLEPLDDFNNDEMVENSDGERPLRFGEKEYNQARDESGRYDKNYYANKQKELDEKLASAKDAKNKNQKEVLKKDENGNKVSVQKNKNFLDKAKDNANVLKAQNDRIQNNINNAKSKLYKITHPLENLKNEAKAKATDAAKTAAKKTGQVAAKAGKAAGKALAKAGQVALKFLLSNPMLLFVIGVIVLIVFLIIIVAGDAGASENNGSNSYSSACDSMSISSTTLTKSEFVEKLSEYASGSSSKGSKTFAENAESIYDIATSNNINPELVVVRAIKEGFSPGASNNNYWGIGCTNTGGKKACKSYSSFDDGVLAFVENVSQYDSVSAMMSRYAYIGSYWYNPGGSGVGGCYYYDYIKEYLSESRSSEVNKVCSSSKSCTISGGSNCTSTTDEDQLAYAKWQVNGMAQLNKNIFGVVPAECKSYSSDCTIYAQGDPKWASTKVGTGGTMSSIGCAVTSIAIGISCSDTPVTVDDFDAGVLVEALNKGKCFSGGNIIWSCSAIQNIAPEVSFVGATDTAGYSNSQKIDLVNSYPQDQYFVLLKIVNSKTRTHYVVHAGTEGEYFVTKNPAGGKINNQLIKDIKKIVVYKY